MGWSSQNVIAQLVIVQGANDALYVYSGAGALGNLIESITSNSTNTTDSFGNTVLPFHAFYDNTLHTAITFDGSQLAAYNTATAAPGPYTWTKTADLLLNDQFVFNTDSSGQPVRFGAGANPLQYFRAFTNQLFVTAGATGPSTTQLVEVQGTAELEKVIISPTLAAASTSAILEVQGAAAVTTGGLAVTGGTLTDTLHATSTSTFDAKETITAGGLAVTGGTSTDTLTATGLVSAEDGIALTNQSAPSSVAGQTQLYSDSFTQLHTDRAMQGDVSLEIKNQGVSPGNGGSGAKYWSSGGHAQVNSAQAGASGDTNTYDVERLTLQIAQQTVTTSTGSGLQLVSTPVGANTYKISVFLPYRGSANAGTAIFAFTSPATSAESCEYLNALSSGGFGATGTVTWSINPVASLAGTFTSPTLSTTAVNVLKVTSIVTFSATGTLAFFCKVGTAGDNVNLFPGYVEIEPVIAT